MTNSDDIRKYYSIFINTMATIARNFYGKVIKNVGDSVIYYFPTTSDQSNERAFRNMLECCITMTAANIVINEKLDEEHLAPLQYRISADYGMVEVARTKTSQHDDLFGSAINLCAKINKLSPPNGILIGGDLFQILKSKPSLVEDYEFRSAGEYTIIGMKYSYPLYSVRSKYSKQNFSSFKQIPGLKPLRQYSQQIEKQTKTFARVMLVDDDRDILFTFSTLLGTQGIKADSFQDSVEALKSFSQVEPNYYDLIILDIRMPNLNGLELYYRLKAIDKDIKILFVSALDAIEELLSILPEFQLENMLKKPVEPNYFTSTIKRILSDRARTEIVKDR